MEYFDAKLLISAAGKNQWPDSELPEIVLAGKSFVVQRDPNYWRYENICISSFGADENKLIIVLN